MTTEDLDLLRRSDLRGDKAEDVLAVLVKAARAACAATEREDDPANLPSDVLTDLWNAIGEAERLLSDAK